ncbi:CLUMA_CG016842, isoform A [Clunio marinus]|uniref:CLUMA_CG016842, isoform A n=1 Tax=Clunio marinus TaxID=568069 RepID=A0A1J1IWJ9_9DIPT|nr:CLUMA_CG016842, isoform A [Clunio marinus]
MIILEELKMFFLLSTTVEILLVFRIHFSHPPQKVPVRNKVKSLSKCRLPALSGSIKNKTRMKKTQLFLFQSCTSIIFLENSLHYKLAKNLAHESFMTNLSICEVAVGMKKSSKSDFKNA